MKQYEKPTLETIAFIEDVITTSDDPGTEDCKEEICSKDCATAPVLDVCKF